MLRGLSRSRALRNVSHRASLLETYGYRCALCGVPLTLETMEADHKVPYMQDPITNWYLMQPLCRACNRRKGAR
jgi:5-methylcytosine-specific restriction endonuclease McrA